MFTLAETRGVSVYTTTHLVLCLMLSYLRTLNRNNYRLDSQQVTRFPDVHGCPDVLSQNLFHARHASQTRAWRR